MSNKLSNKVEELTVNLYLPGEKVIVQRESLDGHEGSEEVIKLGEELGGGYAGRVYDWLAEAVLKVFKPLKWRKEVTRDFSRFLTTFDHPWLKVEVKLAVLIRSLLARAALALEGKELIVPPYDRSIAYFPGLGWGFPIKKCHGRNPKCGPLTDEGGEEIIERAQEARQMMKLFERVGADALVAQVQTSKSEPRSSGYIWMTFFAAMIAALAFFFHFAPPYLVMVILLLSYYFAGASWLSADNMRKKDNVWVTQDVEIGMPHIGFAPPTFLLAAFCIGALWQFSHLPTPWAITLALLVAPGCLFLFELPLIVRNFRKGYPIPFGRLFIEEYKRCIGENHKEFRLALGSSGMVDLWQDISLYQRLDYQFESGRLNPVNRLFCWLAGRPLPFSWQAIRERTLERWELEHKVSPSFARRLKWCHFVLYLSYLLISFIPWRFFFCHEYRQWRITNWRARRIEAMYRNSQVTLEDAKRMFYDGESSWRFFWSYILVGELYRFVFDGAFRKNTLRKSKIWRREIALEVFEERFEKYVVQEWQKGNISQAVYQRVLRLKQDPTTRGWVILFLLLIGGKVITYPAQFFVVGSFFATGGADRVPGYPGWLVGILGWVGLSAIYKFPVTLLICYIFRLELIPMARYQNFPLLGRLFVISINIMAVIFLVLANCIPTVSWYSVPLLVSFSSHRQDFWLLSLVRLQSLTAKVVKLVSLGMWEEGGIGQSYFRKLVPDTAARFLKAIRLLPNEVVLAK